ncbi:MULTISPECIES: pheST operon leader peptide PheM [Arsenophonus]|nr:pheST operon leader peptide PheM [Arsenophonus apicola]
MKIVFFRFFFYFST